MENLSKDKEKAIKISYGTITAILLTYSFIMIFDEQNHNDGTGSLLLIIAFIFKGFYDLFYSIKEKTKVWAVLDLLFIIMALGVLVWALLNYFI
ncbi:hypothetical protein MUN88_07875 [Gracilibacillus caseinilyticus]|uniref:Uncharacterized protein n=1 Tax=Gracilibacillus caseinilyticus TaxID=2932256 RepID=A0ABY4F1L3_9BACI|nr:hypothetical protein [Gracilibacillus caseinilyticus]UOQ49968.1 hypothetical protein MUN88_07875 [Gracilibacillus caseinilyticus]